MSLRCRAARDASPTILGSSDVSETNSSDSSSSESEDLYLKKGKRGPSFIPLLPEKCPEIKGPPLLPERRPEIKGAPRTSFAQINILQSSTVEKKDHIVLVEKSFEICMGAMPASMATTSPPRLMIADKEETGDKPLGLPLLDQMAFQCLDIRVKEQKEKPCNTTEKSTPKTSSQKEGEPTKPNVTTDSAGTLPDSEKIPFVLKAMDEKSRGFLEFHIKKKMVQRRCGVPTMVTKSVNQFQSLKNPFRVDPKRPTQNVLLIPSNAEAPAHLHLPPRNAMAVYVKSLQVSPRTKGYYIFHKVDPEEIRKGAFSTPGKKPGLKTRDSQRTQRNYVLFSVEPEKLRKLLFHLTVKMVEIQKGAFPETVENSFRIFNILSVKPLPKLIHFGNKIPRPKHLSLSFVAREALCIIDLNISHKYVVYTWGIPTLHSKSMEKTTSGISKPMEHPTSTEEKVSQKPHTPVMVLKSPKRRPSSPGIELKQILLIPEPQKPQGSLFPCPAPAEEPQDVYFTDLFKQTTLAPGVPSENDEHPPRSLAVSLRDTTTQQRTETDIKGEGIQLKKAVLVLPLNKRQGPAGRNNTSTKHGAVMEKTTDGKIRTLKDANLQEELQDRTCSTDFPAPLKKGVKADGKEAGSKEDGNQQAGVEGMLRYTALPPSREKGARTGSKEDGNQQAELEGTLRYAALPPSREKGARTGSKEDGNQQAELEGTLRYAALPPSREKGARTGSKEDGNQQAELEGTLRYTALPPSREKGARTGSKEDGNQQAELEGTLRYAALPPSREKGARTGSKEDGNQQAELEGTLRYAALPPSREKGARTGSKEDGNQQAELEGTLRYAALPPSREKGARTGSKEDGNQQAELEGTLRYAAGAEADGEITVAEQARSGQRFSDRVVPSSGSTKDAAAGERKAGAKAARGSQKEAEGRRPSCGPPKTRAKAGGKEAGLKRARAGQKGTERAPRGEGLSLSLGARVARASLFFELDVAREKLNLHLQEKVEAALRPRQSAGLRLSVQAGPGPPPRPRPRRPFCYVCMPPDGRGAALRTVCWALPQRILDMSGGRVPQVARFESGSEPGGGGARAARPRGRRPEGPAGARAGRGH
ncbi:leucine-rich repeat transmembrane protein CCDC168 isoform 1-T3 [Liasis olivaceus]